MKARIFPLPSGGFLFFVAGGESIVIRTPDAASHPPIPRDKFYSNALYAAIVDDDGNMQHVAAFLRFSWLAKDRTFMHKALMNSVKHSKHLPAVLAGMKVPLIRMGDNFLSVIVNKAKEPAEMLRSVKAAIDSPSEWRVAVQYTNARGNTPAEEVLSLKKTNDFKNAIRNVLLNPKWQWEDD